MSPQPSAMSSSVILGLLATAEDLEAARADVELLVMVREEVGLLGVEPRLVMVSDGDPQHDVAAVGRIERPLSVAAFQHLVSAVEPDVVSLLDGVAPIDGGPNVAGGVRIMPAFCGSSISKPRVSPSSLALVRSRTRNFRAPRRIGQEPTLRVLPSSSRHRPGR